MFISCIRKVVVIPQFRKSRKNTTNIDNSDMANTKKLNEEPERILDIVGMETESFPIQQDTTGNLIPKWI